MVLRKVLQLDEPSGPASGPGAVELQQASHAAVLAGAAEHRLVLGVGGLAEHRADLQDAVDAGVGRGLPDFREVLLGQGVHVEAELGGEPVLELADAVGVVETRQAHGLLGEPSRDDGVDAAGLPGEVGVHQHAAVVYLLVHGVELPLPVGNGEPVGVAVDLPLHVHVPDAVSLERLPLLWEILGEVAVAVLEDAVGLLGLGGAEELDEGLALGHLLTLQPKGGAGLREAQRKPAAGRLDHRAVPAFGREEAAFFEPSRFP